MTSKCKLGVFKNKAFLVIGVGLALLVGVWAHLGAPYSFEELIFLSRFKGIAGGDKNLVELSDLMPAKWETVCESHGYDEPLYLAKYKKTFPTAGDLQDGAWSLIFIQDDGNFKQISSNCGVGILVRFSKDRCLSRDEAKLFRVKAKKQSRCEIFSTGQN